MFSEDGLVWELYEPSLSTTYRIWEYGKYKRTPSRTLWVSLGRVTRYYSTMYVARVGTKQRVYKYKKGACWAVERWALEAELARG